jgi:hypothetical protein
LAAPPERAASVFLAGTDPAGGPAAVVEGGSPRLLVDVDARREHDLRRRIVWRSVLDRVDPRADSIAPYA